MEYWTRVRRRPHLLSPELAAGPLYCHPSFLFSETSRKWSVTCCFKEGQWCIFRVYCQTPLTCLLSITIFRVDNNKLGTDSEKSHLHSISFSAANTCQGHQELVATTHYIILFLLHTHQTSTRHTQPLTSAELGELKNVRKGSDCLIGSFVIQFPSPVPYLVLTSSPSPDLTSLSAWCIMVKAWPGVVSMISCQAVCYPWCQ